MPWSGAAGSQTFSRTDGTRSGQQTWQQAQAASVDIISTDHDTHDQDIASGLNACLKKDGGNSATSNIPMGGFSFTNIAAATARTTPARFSDLQDGKGIYVPTVGGTANAITLTNSIAITAYVAGQTFKFIAAATNSGATTINVDGVGTINVYVGGSAISAGMISSGMMITVTYDGTRFQMQAESPAAISVGTIMAWPTATVPTGWLEANGAAVSRTTYSALFAVYSTTYGVGDGSTTFNLPNYEDYFLRGYSASGTDAASRTDRGDGTTGANVGTKQAGDYLAHVHAAGTLAADSNGAHTHTYVGFGAGGFGTEAATGATSGTSSTTSSNGAHTHTISGSTATAPTSGGTETRPKNITVKWIILAIPGAALAFGVSSGTTTDNALARFDGTGGTIQNSGVIVDDSNNVTGVAALAATTVELGHASDTTLSRVSGGVVAIEGSNILTAATGQPLDADLTAIAALTTTAAGRSVLAIVDPNADRMMAWDDSAGAVVPIALADLATEAAPATGDYIVLYGAEGDVRKVNWSSLPGVGGGINNVVEDLTPQLGGDLDANAFNIGFDDNTGIEDDSGNEQLIFQKTASAVNHVEITNAAIANSPSVAAAGDDTNVNLVLAGKGSGAVQVATADINGGTVDGTIIGGSSAAAATVTTLTTTGNVELGHASDTTLSRSAAGVMAVEGVPLYSNLPVNSQSAAYTAVLSDAQKFILHPTADNNARTFTIDSNANVAYPVGTVIGFVNEINVLSIAITSDTLTLAGSGLTGTRSLAANGIAFALKKTSTSWVISGPGLS